MKIRMLASALTAGLSLAAAGTHAQNISDDVVRIGVLTDLSGVYSAGSGIGAVRAAELAVADFGRKVLGKPVELVYADHQNKPDIGVTKAREWFDIGKVDMVLDLVNSAVAVPVQKLGGEKKRLTITTAGGTVALTQQECTPYGIHYAYDTYALASGAGNAVMEEGGKNWYFITSDYTFGHQLERDARAVVERRGGKVLGTSKHPLAATDFSSFVLQAQAAKPDVIGIASGAGDFANAMKAIREFRVVRDGNPKVVGLLVLLTDLKSLGLETVQGMQYVDPWYWDHDADTRAFTEKFRKVHEAPPTFSQAANYSAVMQYLKAIEAAGTDNADAVVQKLRSTKLNDFFLRNASLRQDGRMLRDMYLMEAKRPADSRGDWDLARVKRVIPGQEAFMPLSQSTCPLVKK
jgi:branched-chain amino acid transport system substrate-binding protein